METRIEPLAAVENHASAQRGGQGGHHGRHHAEQQERGDEAGHQRAARCGPRRCGRGRPEPSAGPRGPPPRADPMPRPSTCRTRRTGTGPRPPARAGDGRARVRQASASDDPQVDQGQHPAQVLGHRTVEGLDHHPSGQPDRHPRRHAGRQQVQRLRRIGDQPFPTASDRNRLEPAQNRRRSARRARARPARSRPPDLPRAGTPARQTPPAATAPSISRRPRPDRHSARPANRVGGPADRPARRLVCLAHAGGDRSAAVPAREPPAPRTRHTPRPPARADPTRSATHPSAILRVTLLSPRPCRASASIHSTPRQARTAPASRQAQPSGPPDQPVDRLAAEQVAEPDTAAGQNRHHLARRSRRRELTGHHRPQILLGGQGRGDLLQGRRHRGPGPAGDLPGPSRARAGPPSRPAGPGCARPGPRHRPGPGHHGPRAAPDGPPPRRPGPRSAT